MKFFRKTSAHSRRERAALATDRYLDAIRNLETIRLFAPERESRPSYANRRTQSRCGYAAPRRKPLVIVVVDGLFSLVLICCTAALDDRSVPRRSHRSAGRSDNDVPNGAPHRTSHPGGWILLRRHGRTGFTEGDCSLSGVSGIYRIAWGLPSGSREGVPLSSTV